MILTYFDIFRGLDDMTASKRHSGFFKVVNLSEMVGCLEDLITYFAQPEEELSKILLFFQKILISLSPPDRLDLVIKNIAFR